MGPTISAVVPVFNERDCLEGLVHRLMPVLERITAGSFEVIFTDDGSRDGSSEMLDALHRSDPRLKVIHLSRNFGHQVALQAGLDEARGQAVVLIDADLQDPPELIEEFVARWREGHEVVYAIRRRRKEGALKRAAYAIFYRTLRQMAEVDVPLDAGDFCLLDRRVVDALGRFRERHRFLRGLRSWVGFRQIGVAYERAAREAGAPKYTLGKLIRLALAGYVGFSSMPLRAAAYLGLGASAFGFLLGVWTIISRLLEIPSPRGWTSTIAVMLFIGGVQLLVLGVIGEYLGKVYDEVRQRPLYIVRSKAGLDERE